MCHKQVKTAEKVPLGLRKWWPQPLNRGWPLNTVPLNTGSTVVRFIYIAFLKKNQTVVTGNNGRGPLRFQSPHSPYPWSWATPTKKEEIISDISWSSSFSVTKNFKWSIHLENCEMLIHYNFGITKTRCFCPWVFVCRVLSFILSVCPHKLCEFSHSFPTSSFLEPLLCIDCYVVFLKRTRNLL